MNLSFVVEQGNLNRNAPSEDGKLGVFMLFSEEEAETAEDELNGIAEIFSLKQAKAMILPLAALASYEAMTQVFEDIYAENANAHVYFRAFFVDEALDEFSSPQFNRIEDLFEYSNNTIRQMVVFTNKYYLNEMAVDIQLRLANRFNDTFCGVSAVLGAAYDTASGPFIGVNADRVAISWAKHANGVNAVGIIGGILSKAKVHENIGAVGKFRLSVSESKTFYTNDLGLDIATLTSGQKESFLNAGYVIPIRIPDYSGWYMNDSKNANSFENDFAYIENRRTMDKCIRQVKNALMPFIGASVSVDTTGKMSRAFVASMESASTKGLSQMQNDEEISNYEVYIDPSQQVISTGVIQVVVKIRPRGIARFIVVTIGFQA